MQAVFNTETMPVSPFFIIAPLNERRILTRNL